MRKIQLYAPFLRTPREPVACRPLTVTAGIMVLRSVYL